MVPARSNPFMKNISHLRTQDTSGTRISIVPIPFNDKIRNTNDTRRAPVYLKKHGLVTALEHTGFSVDVHPTIVEKSHESMASIAQDVVSNVLKRGDVCMALGGTHTVALGSVGGALRAFGPDLGVIWIDAHGDLNTHDTSLTGDVRGMVLAALMGIGDASLTSLLTKKLRTKNLLHVGLKDPDQAELDLIRRRALDVVTAAHIAADGLGECARRIERLARRTKHIWISLDVDSIDEVDAPASAMASRGGLLYREITNLVKHIGNTGCVVGMDIVEMAPAKDVDGKTARLCVELAASAFGGSYNWYSQYMDAYAR